MARNVSNDMATLLLVDKLIAGLTKGDKRSFSIEHDHRAVELKVGFRPINNSPNDYNNTEKAQMVFFEEVIASLQKLSTAIKTEIKANIL